MKRSHKPLDLQMNLSLLGIPATTVPDDRRRELAQALMELLISALREGVEGTADVPLHGGSDGILQRAQHLPLAAKRTEFACKAVPNIERNFQRGCGHGHAKRRREGRARMARPPDVVRTLPALAKAAETIMLANRRKALSATGE